MKANRSRPLARRIHGNLVFITCVVSLLVGCDYRVFDLAELEIPETSALFSQKVEPSYESIYNLIIEPRCLTCHQPGGKAEDYPFTTYQELIEGPTENVIIPGNPQSSSFFRVVQPGARRPMPPPRSGLRPLDNFEIEVLRQWIQSGAPGPQSLDENLLPVDSQISESDRL